VKIADLAYEVVKKANRPMHYREITKEVSKTKKLTGRSPDLTVLGSMLKDKDRRFRRVGVGTYAIRH